MGSMFRLARDMAELPGLNWLARPLYRLMFRRDILPRNSYCGVYESFQEACANAPKTRPVSFDLPEAGDLYRDKLDSIRDSDYPVIFWLERLLMSGQRRLFDLGGNIGVSYYGFQRYLAYPQGLRWLVHDVPAVIEAGRQWADQHDARGSLSFSGSRDDADGCDILFCSGVLQYLDFSLAEMLRGMREPPRHVLVNLTPLHPSRTFVTLQRVTLRGSGIANCPYTVSAVAPFVAAIEQLGYTMVDHWESYGRHLRVPFEPACLIDCYHGFYFRRD